MKNFWTQLPFPLAPRLSFLNTKSTQAPSCNTPAVWLSELSGPQSARSATRTPQFPLKKKQNPSCKTLSVCLSSEFKGPKSARPATRPPQPPARSRRGLASSSGKAGGSQAPGGAKLRLGGLRALHHKHDHQTITLYRGGVWACRRNHPDNHPNNHPRPWVSLRVIVRTRI